jgi:WhiB family redox-sensing transcriptional regulator
MSDEYISYQEYELLDFLTALRRSRPSFYEYAACKGQGADAYHPKQGQAAVMREAIKTCFTCPVQKDCHDYALKEKLEYGVWGGSSADQRRKWIQDSTESELAWIELIEKANAL